MFIPIHTENPQARLLDKVSNSLKAGNIVAFPTDTGYAFAVDIFNVKAVGKLYDIKMLFT